jgi:uncharacterized protein
MKYILLVFVLLILFVLYVMNKQSTIHFINGKVARTDKQLKKGLMYRKHKLGNNEGMLFIMKKNYDNSVWMKNTYISLDVIFLDTNMNVVGYKKNTKPLSTDIININKPSSYILEMNSGSVNYLNININDKIIFKET